MMSIKKNDPPNKATHQNKTQKRGQHGDGSEISRVSQDAVQYDPHAHNPHDEKNYSILTVSLIRAACRLIGADPHEFFTEHGLTDGQPSSLHDLDNPQNNIGEPQKAKIEAYFLSRNIAFSYINPDIHGVFLFDGRMHAANERDTLDAGFLRALSKHSFEAQQHDGATLLAALELAPNAQKPSSISNIELIAATLNAAHIHVVETPKIRTGLLRYHHLKPDLNNLPGAAPAKRTNQTVSKRQSPAEPSAFLAKLTALNAAYPTLSELIDQYRSAPATKELREKLRIEIKNALAIVDELIAHCEQIIQDDAKAAAEKLRPVFEERKAGLFQLHSLVASMNTILPANQPAHEELARQVDINEKEIKRLASKDLTIYEIKSILVHLSISLFVQNLGMLRRR